VGTRPEIIRLSRVIVKLDKYFDHTLIHTGQNFDFELNELFFKDLEIREPDLFLECGGENAAKTIARVIEKTDDFLENNPQDAILILGDTNSSLAAIPAKKRKIPIFHMEAGNRSFDQRVPEEINRKIVDHISDINLPYTSIARDYLLREGLKPEFIIKTGSPLDEVITHYKNKIESSNVLKELGLKSNKFFLVSSHREENINSTLNFNKLIKIHHHLTLMLVLKYQYLILIALNH
jgi:UDP-N-acetylglucosamine 2-epimerase (non-hydrolysing)